MEFCRQSNRAYQLCDIHPLFAGLLGELPKVSARHKKAQRRLYPDPSRGEGDEELCQDWDEYVRPELEKVFSSNRKIVSDDLASLDHPQAGSRLVISVDHLDAWINTLNQARLIIVEENGFAESELDQHDPPDLATRRGLALLKLHFYAHLQELLLEVVD